MEGQLILATQGWDSGLESAQEGADTQQS